jgi:hypothetical protein
VITIKTFSYNLFTDVRPSAAEEDALYTYYGSKDSEVKKTSEMDHGEGLPSHLRKL